MKKQYVCPVLDFISVQATEILVASDDEVFVDGEDLFT